MYCAGRVKDGCGGMHKGSRFLRNVEPKAPSVRKAKPERPPPWATPSDTAKLLARLQAEVAELRKQNAQKLPGGAQPGVQLTEQGKSEDDEDAKIMVQVAAHEGIHAACVGVPGMEQMAADALAAK
eukprot:3427318-Pyramimonas_sp.AAC.1